MAPVVPQRTLPSWSGLRLLKWRGVGRWRKSAENLSCLGLVLVLGRTLLATSLLLIAILLVVSWLVSLLLLLLARRVAVGAALLPSRSLVVLLVLVLRLVIALLLLLSWWPRLRWRCTELLLRRRGSLRGWGSELLAKHRMGRDLLLLPSLRG